MRLTYDALDALGTCGNYLSRFRRLFPTADYPDGVELTRANCEAHHDQFDWSWAVEVLLTHAGQRRYRELLRSSSSAEFGAGPARAAAIVGHLLEHHPELRSARLVEVTTSAVERADRRVLRELAQVEEQLADARRYHAYYGGQAAELEVKLAGLTAPAAGARLRDAERAAVSAAAAVAAAEAQLVELRATADATTAAVVELRPTPAEPTDEADPDDGSNGDDWDDATDAAAPGATEVDEDATAAATAAATS